VLFSSDIVKSALGRSVQLQRELNVSEVGMGSPTSSPLKLHAVDAPLWGMRACLPSDGALTSARGEEGAGDRYQETRPARRSDS